MAEETQEDRRLIQYLLGLLPEEETERLDELSVSDDGFAWRLRAVENDLVDAYVRHELSGEALDRFQSYYLLSPQRREKVKFAEALVALENQPAPVSPRTRWFAVPLLVPRWGFVGIVAAALFACGYLLYDNLQLRNRLSQARSAPVPVMQREPQPGPALKTLAVVLVPPTRSAAKMLIVAVPAGTDRVTFELQIETDDFPLYRVDLKSLRTNQILWGSGNVKAESKDGRHAVSIDLPASLLRSQSYVLDLFGMRPPDAEPIASYVFAAMIK